MDPVSVSAIVGASATVLTFVWVLIGNPNLLSHFRSKRTDQPAGSTRDRKVTRVSWAQVETAVTAFVKACRTEYDLVVGVQPDGVIIATAIAGQMGCRLTTLEKVYPGVRRRSFFVFEEASHARSLRETKVEFLAPSGIRDGARILVVDAVTTFGNSLLRAEKAVTDATNGAEVNFFVYAVDEARLNAANPSLAKRLTFSQTIDNYKVWLKFPWETS